MSNNYDNLLDEVISDSLIIRYMDTGFPYYYIGKKMLDYFGYDSEEEFKNTINGNMINCIHPDDIEFIINSMNKQLADAKKYTIEYRIRKKDGSYIWVQDRGKQVAIPDGKDFILSTYYDLSKQKENEELNKYLIDAIPGGISVCQGIDRKIKTISFTVGVASLLGYTEEEYREHIKDDTLNVIYEEDREKILNIIYDENRENPVKTTSVRCYCQDGYVTWLQLSAKIIGEKDGIPLWYIILVGMSDESQLYYDIVHHSTNGVYVIEENSHKLLYANNEMEQILAKVNIHDFIGKKCYRALKNFDKPCEECIAYPSNNEGKGNEIYVDFLEKYYFVDSHAIKWRGVPSYVVYLSDISEEKKANNEITQIYNNIPGAVFRCKFDENWTVISANDGLFEFLGYTRAEFAAMGNKMSAVIHPHDLPEVFSDISAQLGTGTTSVKHEQRVICKDGTIKWILINGQLLENKAEGNFFYCVFVDISEQKRAQFELNKTRKKLTAAIDHAGLAYWEYDILNNRAYLNSISTKEYPLNKVLENYPKSLYESGSIHQDSIELYDSLVEAIKHGQPTAMADIKTINANGDLIWKRTRFTAIFDEYGKAVWAVATAESINEYKELENRFATVLEQNKIDSWMYDIQEHTIIQNHNTEDIYGIHNMKIPNIPETLIEQKLCYPNDAEAFRDFYKKLHNGENQVSTTIRLWDARTEKYVWKRCTYTVLPNRDRKPIYALGSAVDVTDQVEVKQKYNNAIKYRYNTLGENVILAGHCNLTQNKIIEINDKTGLNLEKRFGMVREDFFRGIASLIPNKEQQKIFCKTFLNENIKSSFDLGISQQNYDCTISLGKNKGISWISTHVDTVLQPETNELIGFLTVTDVTAKKIQEQVLDSVIQFDYDYVAHLNLHSNTTVFYNSKIQNSELQEYKDGVPYTYTDTIALTAKNFITKKDKALYLQNMSIKNVMEQLKNKDSYEFTYHLKEANGEIRTKQARFATHDKDAGIVVFSRADVTDILAQEEKQKIALSESLTIAQQANNSKSKFLASMSHDIRTPMNAIIGMCNLAIADESNAEQIHESLEVIQQSSGLLLFLINDILDMNRIESGKMVLANSSFSISEQLQIAAARARALASKKHQIIEMDLDIIHDCCSGDIMRIHRIVDNILANALKFTPEGGKITYHLSESALENKNIGLYRFEISDNGIGISAEQQKYIFEPFYRAENSMTSNVEGAGLGLSIVKSIVDYMGGTISLSSIPGIGTTFVIELPLRFTEKQAPKQADKDIPPESLNLAGMRILLCEDHSVNQLVAKRILEKQGITVTMANNGETGFNIFTKSKPGSFDAILMDIQMPVMNGYEATDAIRKSQHPQGKTIPIIAMTANAFAEDVQKSIAAGMNEHLAKPIEPQQLYSTLAKYMR
ncbi:MAG: PAS domain-containing protein [Clostridiales bacterium]